MSPGGRLVCPAACFARAVLTAIAFAAAPFGVAAQEKSHGENPVPSTGADPGTCALSDQERGGVWLRVLGLRQIHDDAAKPMLRFLQDSLAVEAAARPVDVDIQYELALVVGRRAEIEGGTEGIRTANALDRQARAVLVLAPTHSGAQHLLGRLQAAVLRMSRITRFAATRLLGGGRLGSASWNEARSFLEAAAEGDPCVPDHLYELAHLYEERGDPERAELQLQRLFLVAGSRELYADVVQKGRKLAEEIARDGRRRP